MSMGQEGDTRRFRKARRGDYADTSAASEAERRQPTTFPLCETCKQPIRGENFGGFCLRCHNEPL